MNIIITGGSNGIGKQTALRLASDKKNIILITGRSTVKLAKVSDEAPNQNIRYLSTDLRDLHKNPDAFRSVVVKIFSSVDILINNAGTLFNSKFSETDEDQAREMMEVNFFAPMIIIKSLLPLMTVNSHIVNISSMGGYQGSAKFPGLSYYSASKAALACISECLAGELSEKKIFVNCLALGSAGTEMLEKAFPGYKAPVSAVEMGKFVADFAINGSRFFNGKILPVALTTP
jgi:short-subunit dehydrogenase